MMSHAAVMISVGVAGAGVCFALLSWGANRMLYYPMRYPAGEWEVREALHAADVELRAADGTKLHGWWAGGGAPLATLHLHGNAGNVSHRGLAARSIMEAGSAVLLLDYRGYGKSEGTPSERGLYADAEAAFDWIAARGYAPERIVIHGESLGTAVATWLAVKRGCAGLVLEAPFTSAGAVAGTVVPLLGPLLIRGYNSLGRIRDVRAPLLVIHGDRDEVIRYSFGQELFRAANEPKSFWTVRGAGHNDLHITGRAEFPGRLAAFYATLPPPR